jgi:hypothetical protein
MTLIERWRRLSMHPAIKPLTERRIHAQWMMAGRPIPAPPIVKQRILRRYRDRYALDTLVETGTFTGETVEALRRSCVQIVSIELAPALHAACVQRFDGIANVRLLEGDSAALLPGIVAGLTAPALFWLDGHYTGGDSAGDGHAPLMDEIAALLARPARGDVILIDDARCLTGHGGYPSVDAVYAAVRAARPRAEITLADDVIRWIDCA